MYKIDLEAGSCMYMQRGRLCSRQQQTRSVVHVDVAFVGSWLSTGVWFTRLQFVSQSCQVCSAHDCWCDLRSMTRFKGRFASKRTAARRSLFKKALAVRGSDSRQFVGLTVKAVSDLLGEEGAYPRWLYHRFRAVACVSGVC